MYGKLGHETTRNSARFDCKYRSESMGSDALAPTEFDTDKLCDLKLLKTPRTLEACFRLGIVVEEFVPKQLEDFINVNNRRDTIEKEAARIRLEHYEIARTKKIAAVVKERERIVKEMAVAPPASPTRSTHNTQTLSSSPSTCTMLLLEEKRIDRIKRRQQKELQSVIEMEKRLAQIQEENSQRAAAETAKKNQFQNESRKKHMLTMAQKHDKEMEKKVAEDKKALECRLLAKRAAERERALQEEEERRQQEHIAAIREKEKVQNRKAEEFRKQTEALLKQQEDQLLLNRQKMLLKEEQLTRKMEVANRRHREEAAERQQRANLRKKHALEQNELAKQKRKNDFDEKQAQAVDRAMQIQKKAMTELKEGALRRKEEDEMRKKRFGAALLQHESATQHLLTKRKLFEEKQAALISGRQKERALTMLEKHLTLEDKHHNVERIKRVEEYNRAQMLKKIADKDTRTRILKEKKKEMINQSKQIARASFLRKVRISEAVDQFRVSKKWDQLEEKLVVQEKVG
uniref:Uncharacterized protein AlNc14C188G8389 n=1 Tax=Albugo laibachii Nc14 TaxID=890382 RepID=F0WFK6_9STRA|nr:conserved hypothetical protein [Albugo laibachii Nc14]CCA23298.1 conserved hypothetical protein [Albugo laibachii Nc14]|eukprot:CCA23298.1 conserved hypothetical protein [Albugo laibachii Nc14]